MAYLFVDYEEFKVGSYESITVDTDSGESEKFDSGDVVQDWKDAIRFGQVSDGCVYVSSTADNFLSDHFDIYHLEDGMIQTV